MKSSKKRIRNYKEELKWRLKSFPNDFSLMYRNNAYRVALILFLAGAKDVQLSYSWFNGDKELENIHLHGNSISVSPYIEYNQRPLLWFLLEKLKYFDGGSAGKDGNFMQVSCLQIDNFYELIMMYFQILKREFRRG